MDSIVNAVWCGVCVVVVISENANGAVGRFGVEFAAHQGDRFVQRPAALEAVNRESPVTRGKSGVRDEFQRSTFFLRALSVMCFCEHWKREV